MANGENERFRGCSGGGFEDIVSEVASDIDPVITPDGTTLIPYRVVDGDPERVLEFYQHEVEVHGIHLTPPKGSVSIDRSAGKIFGFNYDGNNPKRSKWIPNGPKEDLLPPPKIDPRLN